ncbi:TetR/AcrR family transcriptional regulator C-terminal domain-containing protein [Nonomuraea sp. K274]|uniref:TetR/AcrR family transcriptional regulator C-terminal domain-containing protein n=1 Tax=Nonomuraea cypriaca TaxID=1187855 RepID=A0A931A8M0_9ACTN|nr:TetR/AcrR family transcriptional regulator [Nonomuraea cypriaca]MBF8184832.1 TetR/AcrR family transcriptional regulator C-terminal domain-containing protein [Nonomuraea cypriaca]
MATSRDSNTPSRDRRVRRTRTALARALLDLAEKQDLSQISVSDVAEHAGVSRTAFYDHYRDVHALAEAACTAMIDNLIESLPSPGPGSPDPTREGTQSLTAFFASLAQHTGLYRSLLGPQGSARVADHIRRRITAAIHNRVHQAATGELPQPSGSTPDMPHDVLSAFAAGALIGVAADWLQRGCPQTPAQMAALTWPLLNSLYRVDTDAPA